MDDMKLRFKSSVSLKNLFRYASGQDFLFITTGSLAAVAMGILQPLIFVSLASVYGEMNPSATSEEYLETASEICLYMLFGGVLLTVFCFVAMFSWIRVGSRQGLKYRSECFKRILKQDIEGLEQQGIGEMAPLLASDSLKIERATGDKIINFIYPLSIVLTGLFICLYSSAKLTLLCLFFGVFIVFGLSMIKKGIELKMKTNDSSYMKAASIAEEALMEIKTVSSLNSQSYQVNKYAGCLQDSEKYTMKVGLYTGLGMGVGVTAHLFEVATLYIIGSRDLNDGEENWIRGNKVELTEILSIFYISILVCSNIASLFPSLKTLREGQIAASRLSQIIDSSRSVVFGNSKQKIQGEIEFRDLSFSYPTRQNNPILKQVSFRIAPSAQLGVVGTTGSGKSTLISLLLRFYNPVSGEILIDGVPIQHFSKKTLRNAIGLVSQEPFLFDASILENLQYANPSASFEEIKDAACKSGALEFINDLPDKFDTVVGAKGSQLSGGQKQRIVIARAILRSPQILILDEATSALDRSTEQEVISTIEKNLPETTRVCIAQNLLTLKNSDNIIILEEGRIVEEGNHKSLIRQKGKYFKLFQMQKIQERDLGEEKEVNREVDVARINNESEEIENTHNNKQNIKRILQLESSQCLWLVMGIIGSIIIGAVFPFIGVLTGLQVNLLLTERGESLEEQTFDYSTILYIIDTIFFLGFVLQSLGYPKISAFVTSKLRKESLSAMLSFDSEFYTKNSYSSLSNRLASDCEAINDIGATFIGIIGAFFVAVFVSISLVAYFSWEIALMFLVILPITLTSMSYGLHGSIQGIIKFNYSSCDKIASDSLLNIRTIKALGLETHFHEKYEQAASEESLVTINKALSSGITYGISVGTMYWYYALMLWYGAKMHDEDLVSFQDMLASNFCGLTASNVFFMIVIFMGDIGGGFAAAKRIFSMLEYKPKIDVRSTSGESNPVHGKIQFQNVSFSYPGRDCLALKDVSFVVEPSTKCAVIGRTGSGKSTIAQLLIRLYDPSCGSISLDGVALNRLNLKHLRENIGIVIQEPVLFSGTIQENITLGRDIKEDELSEAVEIARVSEFLDSEHIDKDGSDLSSLDNTDKNKGDYQRIGKTCGLNRDVGFKGSSLSGGQKQRVAIARTVIKKPKVLIFDEATSALDPETESVVMGNLERSLEGSTWIIIAHRMKTVSDADSVLVLESGSVVEFGSRDELIEKRGYFYKMSQDISS